MPAVTRGRPPTREPSPRAPRVDVGGIALHAAIVLGLAVLVGVTITGAFGSLFDALEAHRWGVFLKRPAGLWTMMGSLLLCARTALWWRYEPAAEASWSDAPRMTVVIPAYNEGAMVARAIDSVAAARYPRARLEIFAIDDGSGDDTWKHIQEAARRHVGLVTALRLPRNAGKRRALAEGFRRSSGEILVTIDSDSIIDPGALLALAGPFRVARVGSVAGKVTVLNRTGGVIPRMLAVRFALTFDFLRAVQSTYGTVYCCPGALTGYRADAVRRVLERWLEQTFLGTPCTYGEDRAMTNLLLAEGFDSVYQRTAVVETVVPHTYSKLCRMFLRWDRSYIREEIRFARIVWTRPLLARLMSVIDVSLTNLRYPISYASLVLLVVLGPSHPLVLLRFLAVVGAFSFFNMLYYLRTERSRQFVYGIAYSYFAVFALWWIFPYAALTVRARGWLTR